MFLLYSKFLLILLTALNISNFLKFNFFKINLLLISTYTIIIFYFSFFGFYNFINITITIFLILNSIYFIFNFNKSYELYYISSILFVLLIAHYFIPEGFLYWDEFTQWGTKPKEIFLNKSVFFDDYPITTNNKYWLVTLYHNFVIYGFNTFDEKAIILSQIFIHISSLMFIYSFIKKKTVFNFVLIILLFYFSSSIFNYGFYTVYLDLLVFLYFLCIFLIIFNNRVISWNDTWIIGILLSFLFLIKGISIFFGLLILLYLVVANFQNKISFKKLFLIILIFILVIISYQIVINFNDLGYHIKPIPSYYSSKIEYSPLNDYFKSAFYSINIYEGKFLNLFFKILENLNFNVDNIKFINFKLNFYFWIIFLVSINLFFLKIEKDNSYFFNTTIFCIITVSIIIFTIFIYYAYKNYFGEAEASSMSSFGRYFGIFFIFWLFIIFINLINLENKSNIFKFLKWSILTFVIISSPGKAYENILNKIFDFDDSYQSNLIKKKETITQLSKYIKKDKSVYFIDQDKDEFLLRVARFITYPTKSNELCSSIVDTKDKQKTYDCVISKNDFHQLIKNYDYLFFLNENVQIIKVFDLDKKVKNIKTLDNISLYEIN